MGWEYTTNGKPQLYYYPKATATPITVPLKCTSPTYFTWAAQHFWETDAGGGYEYCVKYTNDTENPIAFSSVAIKACACDSGGNEYWAWGSKVSAPGCVGYGAEYYAYVRVSNDNQTSFKSSKMITSSYVTLPNTDGTNMNYPGYDGTHTAVFGQPPYVGVKGLVPREFIITDCPLIEPGGVGYIHFGITNFEVPKANGQYQFILNPKEMTVEIDEGVDPYIWVYNKDKDHPGWHLFRPLYVFDGNWQSGDGE